MKLIQYLSLAVFLLSLLALVSFYSSPPPSDFVVSRPSYDLSGNQELWVDDNLSVQVGSPLTSRPFRVEVEVDGTPYTYYWVVRSLPTEVRVTASFPGTPDGVASIVQPTPNAPPVTIESRDSQDNEIIVQYATQVAEVRTWATASADTYATREAILLDYIASQTAPSNDGTLINLWFVALISLATFVTTTGFRVRDERRYTLEAAKTQLEIEKLRKELNEKNKPAK